ncbi:MAG: sigma-54-dependent Fis family transcriptional regulator [Verrucomicrobia bacterium]|nr:MAG: sigma-54-dependent Fis family transcriptional regulator [Verrucomicrobiota bacterium]
MRVLIVDDEENIRRTMTVALEAMGHAVVGVERGEQAIKQVEQAEFDVAFLDLMLNGESGLDVLPKLLERNPRLEIIVFTAYASIETAVEAMRRGAVDYLAKPFTPEQLRRTLDRILKAHKLENRVAELESRLSGDIPSTALTTAEPAVQKAFELAMKAAPTQATILLLGESGTGKSVLARAIHENSLQKENRFVTVNCPSLSRELLESELFGHVKGSFTGAVADTQGKIALADGGTLFLDEIGELPLEIQPKLLRLLQEKEYERVGETKTRRANVRVISATNRDLEQHVKDGQFREDLYYRLNVISVYMPALKERLADLPAIADGYLHFFAQQCGKHLKGLSKEVEFALRQYSWPGNLRELRNVIERAVILSSGREVTLSELPEKINPTADQRAARGVQVGERVSLDQLEQEHIALVVQQSATLEEAAKVLGIDPATLYRKRKKFAA